MSELLFLCHRMPYPPNKGDKIRAYHWLKALAANYRVHLGTFVDDPQDWAHRSALEPLCATSCFVPLEPRRAKLRSLSGLVRRQALSLSYYRDRAMTRWVDRVLAERPISAVLVFSSTMAPYVQSAIGCRRVLDFVDVDSDKWRQVAQRSGLPMRWVYSREARKLLCAERRLARDFDASVFVSEAEADFFRAAAPESAERVHAIGNGVDADYFDPKVEHTDPYNGQGARQIVFTGVMDYSANVDAVSWFVRAVLPLVREAVPGAALAIVGTRPTARVSALAEEPGVMVTGSVDDVRPYTRHAAVAIAPMRIARGIQNKVLEALAMGRPVVMTPQAAAGLVATDSDVACVAVEPDDFARAVVDAMTRSHTTESVSERARAYVRRHYSWAARFDELLALMSTGHDQQSALDSASTR